MQDVLVGVDSEVIVLDYDECDTLEGVQEMVHPLHGTEAAYVTKNFIYATPCVLDATYEAYVKGALNAIQINPTRFYHS